MKYVKGIKLRNKILMALLAASLIGGSVTGCGSSKSDEAGVTNYSENQYAVSYENEAAGQGSAEVADYELEQDNASEDGDYGFEKSVENYDEAKVSDDTKASTKNTQPAILAYCWKAGLIAISMANKPNNVVNLIIGFIATEEVSLKGSPTVSPTTAA